MPAGEGWGGEARAVAEGVVSHSCQQGKGGGGEARAVAEGVVSHSCQQGQADVGEGVAAAEGFVSRSCQLGQAGSGEGVADAEGVVFQLRGIGQVEGDAGGVVGIVHGLQCFLDGADSPVHGILVVAAFHGEAGDLPDGLALGGGEGGFEGGFACVGVVEVGGIRDDEVFLDDAEGEGGVDGLRGGSAGGHADADGGAGGEEDGVGFFDAGDEDEVAADDEASVGVGAVGGAGPSRVRASSGGGGEGGGAVEVGVALGVGGGGVGVVGGVGFSDGGEEVGAEEGDLIARLAGVDAQAGADGEELGGAEVEGEGGVLRGELLADDFRLPVFGDAGEGAGFGALAEGRMAWRALPSASVAFSVCHCRAGGVGQGGADVSVGAGGYFKGKVEADGAVIGGDEQGGAGRGRMGPGAVAPAGV